MSTLNLPSGIAASAPAGLVDKTRLADDDDRRTHNLPLHKDGAMTLAQFIAAHSIRIRSSWAAFNPHMDGSDQMDNWKCRLRIERRTMTLYFSKGIAHRGAKPTADEVLECLTADAVLVANARDFTDWCSELGYDCDSRKAERSYRTCQRQAASLKRLLGIDAYETLLWKVEH